MAPRPRGSGAGASPASTRTAAERFWLGRGAFRQVRFEHRLDRRRARAALDAVDCTLAFDEYERRDLDDAESFRELGLLVDIDANHAKSGALLPRQVREQTLH